MTTSLESAAHPVASPLGLFERYLTLWVFLCILGGTLLGLFAPTAAQAVGALEVAQVNIPVGLLIWVMIIPMLMKIDFSAIGEFYQQRAGLGVTLSINWLIKPFTMAFMAWLFLRHVFAAWLPAEQLDSYVAGLILLGAAPCTAMVFAFAPIVALLLGVSSIPVPWDTLLLSVVMYIVIPLAIAQFIRARLLRHGDAALQAVLTRIGPFSILALLATLVLLFSFQGQTIVAQPLIIAMLAVPILLQTLFIAALGYWMCRQLKVRHDIAGPAAMIGASNFFELAVAVAIALYGFNSGAALATVVGVLIEVPVMLWLVRRINASKEWYERTQG
ncbi:arsenic resistance protein [Pseudomonas anguilliseptica]|uniref:Arsenite transporter, ACR3 family n=1 Tax=Pseudomonas anguilliseptica TaxID=53406 RepID=A0A1H4ZQL3_PSEAG|nr:arsenic resistance protein [Pseudomonas anguilliseptica]SED31784.1 arsenite transporter, ACR3 family [Pseudomonas anguilliseptica]